ncbi:hypothetical protein AVEN_29971-1 [Araneus ventricosus]|uniref:Uncharacterized protein n=1 Tax=Araneus ventricosus TaxID=182803 RepID=A0A4Y2NYZ7_ARAVE|nr:hypothetical protein AVEN_233716-1 [Araneus ventricosus]GBN43033.1 hypothetical protein AVEN_29971-1 [Araneus ventricosus]
MRYMGSIGKILGGYGDEGVWCEVFAKNDVVYMANGYAYSIALRAHSLSQAGIGLFILHYCEENEFLSGYDIETLRRIHNEVINLSPFEESSFLSKVKPSQSAVSSTVKTLEERSRAAEL